METKIVNTWLIENNKLVNKNKKVSSIKYKDLELYFLNRMKIMDMIWYHF